MYRLIWETSVASFMKPSVVSVIQATITAPDGHVYTHSAELPVYAGWKSIMGCENNILKGLNKETSPYNFFENLSQNLVVTPSIIEAKQECVGSRNQLHYTESALIRLLEEEGIGRPSTFASIVDKIQTRNYVSKETLEGTTLDCIDFVLEPKGLLTSTSTATIKTTTIKKTFGAEKNKLVVSPMGIVVSRFLYQHFEPLFNYSYTRNTETLLDAIHEGTSNWIEVCANQKQYIANLVKQAKSGNLQKFNIPIDSTHCYTIAKYGPVIKQTIPSAIEGQEPEVKWLPVRKDIDIIRLERGEYTLQELLQIKPEPGNPAYFAEHTPGGLPLYGGHYFGVYEDKEIIIRKGKFGRYAAWGDENRSIKCFGSRNVANITMEEMVAVLAKPKRASADPRPSGDAIATPTPSIEQIPKASSKKPKVPLAPKAPKKSTPTPSPSPPSSSPSSTTTDPAINLQTEAPKKRGRPKKVDNNNIDK
jgi:DNA topoisomerase-1